MVKVEFFLFFSCTALYIFADETASPKRHQRSQSDGTVINTSEESTDSKKDADKKTVKNILSQLLPSSTNLAQITVG